MAGQGPGQIPCGLPVRRVSRSMVNGCPMTREVAASAGSARVENLQQSSERKEMAGTTYGFIGAGQMARALAGGIVRAGLADAERIWAGDPAAAARQQFASVVAGAHVVETNAEVAAACQLIVLAVKPQLMDRVLEDLAPHVGDHQLIVSIAAGVQIQQIRRRLGDAAKVIRVMPNTPCLVGQGASGYSLGPGVSEDDGARVDRLLSAAGRAFQLDERLLDAVTGLSGSGPAFVCVIIEALSDGGVRMGLPRSVAMDLAVQTVRGTAELIGVTGDHPAVIKDRVASPGGTTIAGLDALEAHGVRRAMMAAVEAATRRSEELGREPK